MFLKQMFPKETLDAEDLNAYSPMGAVVTIERLDYKTLQAKRRGEPEIAYYLKAVELAKPFKLNKTNAYAIAELLGTEDTNQWTGKRIRLMPIRLSLTDRSTGKPVKVWSFDVDMMVPQDPPVLMPNTDITGMAADAKRTLPGRPLHTALPQGGAGAAMGELTPIGEDKAIDIAVALSERGRQLTDIVAHLESIGLGGLVEGKLPPAWPQAILPVARKFCGQLPKCAAPMSPSSAATLRGTWKPTEVLNRQTGEVIAAPTAPQDQQTVDGYQPINEDDIPF